LIVRQVEPVRAFQRGERDREVLDRVVRGVEDGDVVVASATGGRACEHVAELRHVGTAEAAGLDRVREVAVVRRLLEKAKRKKANF
jgi:hypothetical protein